MKEEKQILYCKKCRQTYDGSYTDLKFCGECGGPLYKTEMEIYDWQQLTDVKKEELKTNWDSELDLNNNFEKTNVKCPKCGCEISSNIKFCPECGTKLDNKAGEIREEKNTMAIVGFVLSILAGFLNLFGIISILSVVFSSIGLSNANRHNVGGKGLSIAGLIIGAICFFYYVYSIYELLDLF
ncbi:MAG: zinc ribbon domain-containing protein [Erysipelotrichaceae bacterium]|nr:zinc ribbon domain-containing protein [Erysipelotrichaceae bacterium]